MGKGMPSLRTPAAGRPLTRAALASVGLLLAISVAACDGNSWFSRKDPAAMRVKPENGGITPPVEDWAHVPVPPADGPLLAPIAMQAPVYAKPDPKAEVVGYLRLGAKVARSANPLTKDGCAEGWYAVRPLGFVCAGPNVTVKLDHPLVRAMAVEPDRKKPMPYAYAFLRSIAPSYMKVPTKDDAYDLIKGPPWPLHLVAVLAKDPGGKKVSLVFADKADKALTPIETIEVSSRRRIVIAKTEATIAAGFAAGKT